MSIKPMSAKELTQRILNDHSLFVLDVRNEKAFQDWKIEGMHFEYLNMPYFDLIDGIDHIIDQIPENQDILVVCAKQGSSEMVAQHLVDAGLEHVFFLEGGMTYWGEYLHPVKIADLNEKGTIYQFVRMGKGCLSYMIESNGEAIVIDPSRMITQYLDFAEDIQVQIRYVIDTHLHADHISGGRLLRDETGARYYLPPQDAEEVQFTFEPLVEGVDIPLVEALYSPGHTIGSTSIIVDQQYLLTGDILFIASVGRPDLAGKANEWSHDLYDSLYQKYKQLPFDLIVLPAHFGKVAELGQDGSVQATLDELYKSNPGLKLSDKQRFHQTVAENLPPQPHAYQDIRHTNMGIQKSNEAEQREMEMGPNRCAVHD
ncbi:MBL fold metallo-hydrolase [Hazenella sp. IB182353]|uniref:MBL fold metallo-hydrolase n=1 Tax=Polycladospora coralii TaxID=2771432 RepID=UPI00174661EB|nr:MBL fold metallo-hydrolase [Polycladospora coralii]MBS7528992.1 MBL fold metallo-hydrolase [Polycladospora coralii]